MPPPEATHMSDTAAESPAPTADEALHTTLDEMIGGMLGHDGVERTALIVVCHPEIARDALPIGPTLGLLPCTTLGDEREGDDSVHVHRVSATKAIRDLGRAPGDCDDAVADSV